MYSVQDSSDDMDPVICSISHEKQISFAPREITQEDPIPSQVHEFTPSRIQQLMYDVHSRCEFHPNKKFLSQHALAISTLPSSTFRRYCSTTFQLDSGANVFAITCKSMFYFFIERESKAQQVDGSYFSAKGWGGI